MTQKQTTLLWNQWLDSIEPDVAKDIALDTTCQGLVISRQTLTQGLLPSELAHTSARIEPSEGDALPSKKPLDDLQHLPLISLGRQTSEQAQGVDAANEDLALLGLLGQGGMGIVYEARQHSLDRIVAVKRLQTDAHDSPVAARNLIREARIMGSLEHPNIIPVHAVGRDAKGQPVITMKRIEGANWRSFLKDPAAARQLSWGLWSEDALEQNIKVLIELCHAISFAHHRNIVHRDIKPDNVMLGEFGEIYLLDWGLATVLPQDACAIDIATEAPPGAGLKIIGTPTYMAPEMIYGDPQMMDARTDVYLLGATLHEILTGVTLHQGRTIHEILYGLWARKELTFPDGTSDELAAICRRATASSPAERYPDVASFRSALEHFLQHRTSSKLCKDAARRLDELRTALAAQASSTSAPCEPSSEPSHGHPISSPLVLAQQLSRQASKHIHQLGIECRFGYRLALREWPDNPDALAGLEACTRLLLQDALRRKALTEAEQLLQELHDPPPAFQVALKALEREIQQHNADHARLKGLEHDLDMGISLYQRRWFYLLMLVLSALFSMLTAPDIEAPFSLADARQQFLYMVGLVGCFGLMIFWFRGPLWKNTANRRFAMILMSALLALLGGRFQAWSFGVPVAQGIVQEVLLLAVACAAVSIFIQPWLWWSSLLFAVTGILGVHFHHLLVPMAILSLCSVWVFSLVGSFAVEKSAMKLRKAHGNQDR